MRWFAFGTSPVGVVAIGANATGVLAFGQLATGVVAIGQLSRGVVTVGQLSLGVFAIGQLAVGVVWATGQLGVAAFGGAGLVLGPLGRLSMMRLLGRESGRVLHPGPADQWCLGCGQGDDRAVAVVAIWSFGAASTGLISGLDDVRNGGPPSPTTTTTRILR